MMKALALIFAVIFMSLSGTAQGSTPIAQCGATISQPGAYHLTGNLTATGTGECITISASDVTLDLLGFVITGSGSSRGILVSGGSNVEVRNGTIRNFANGIQGMGAPTYHSLRMINIRALRNTGNGIYSNTRNTVVKDCVIAENGSHGVRVENGLIAYNSVHDNGMNGISASDATITNNVVSGNGEHGIFAGQGSYIAENSVTYNMLHGIYANYSATVTDNTLIWNFHCGIMAEASLVTNNTVNGNNVSRNANNRGGGICVQTKTIVRGNSATENRVSNIYVYSHSNVIEDNFLAFSTSGIKFQVEGNFYARNRARSHTTHYHGGTNQTNGGGNVSF